MSKQESETRTPGEVAVDIRQHIAEHEPQPAIADDFDDDRLVAFPREGFFRSVPRSLLDEYDLTRLVHGNLLG